MALKPLLFLLASFLLVTTRASHDENQSLLEVKFKEWSNLVQGTSSKVPVPVAPAESPVKAPAPISPVKAPVVSPLPPKNAPVASAPPPPKPVVPLPPVSSTECAPLCSQRCSLHSRKNLCARACLTCCYRCKCVPPGTYGNREQCGTCYTGMKTHNGRPKCP